MPNYEMYSIKSAGKKDFITAGNDYLLFSEGVSKTLSYSYLIQVLVAAQ